MEDALSRRRLLRLGMGATGVGVVGSLSGCSGTERTNSTEPHGSQQWLVAPSVFGIDHYIFEYNDYEQIRTHADEFGEGVYSEFSDRIPTSQPGLSVDDVDQTVILSAVEPREPTVLLGRFTKDELTDGVENLDTKRRGDVGGYTLYVEPDGGVAAIKDGALIIERETTETDTVEAVIETTNGNHDRYTDTNEDMRELLDAIGEGTFNFGKTFEGVEETDPEAAQFAGQVAYGYADTVDGESTTTRIVVLFESPDDVDMDTIEGYIDSGVFEKYESISSAQDGRKVTITGEVDTGDLYT